jgi:hypothetical protein
VWLAPQAQTPWRLSRLLVIVGPACSCLPSILPGAFADPSSNVCEAEVLRDRARSRDARSVHGIHDHVLGPLGNVLEGAVSASRMASTDTITC